MRNSPKLLVIFGLLFLFINCQRDDICPAATETTLPVTISFFDITNPDNPKPPVNLTVRAQGVDSIYKGVFNNSEIKIPLRTDVDLTTYVFTINTTSESADEDISNSDVIKFTYGRKQVYINRACSYKVEYTGLAPSIVTDNDDNLWIKRITVNNENDTIPHIFIYH